MKYRAVSVPGFFTGGDGAFYYYDVERLNKFFEAGWSIVSITTSNFNTNSGQSVRLAPIMVVLQISDADHAALVEKNKLKEHVDIECATCGSPREKGASKCAHCGKEFGS